MTSEEKIKLVLGLKVRHYRTEKGWSGRQLSEKSGLSPSYLTEIEKGLKYPTASKMMQLAGGLEVEYNDLVSLEVPGKLQPIAAFLESGVLDDLSLGVFGLDSSTLVELIANAPSRIHAFISTFLKISNSYEIRREQFYFAALRSYQEMHRNYFEELEQAVEGFVRDYALPENGPPSIAQMETILQDHFGVRIDTEKISTIEELKGFRSAYNPEEKVLYLGPGLNKVQLGFALGRELAFQVLKMDPRPLSVPLQKVASFEEALHNFNASYFSVALLMSRRSFLNDLKSAFANSKWEPEQFIALMEKYHASPEMFLHRLTNLLPTFLGLEDLFFLRFIKTVGKDHFTLTKELHLNRMHFAHGNEIDEHYCRRWITLKILNQLESSGKKSAKPLIAVQRSRHYGSDKEYLLISLSKTGAPGPDSNVSVSIGIPISAQMKKRIKFWNDPSIQLQEVFSTCERCPIEDCNERVAAPSIIQAAEKQAELRQKLHSLTGQDS